MTIDEKIQALGAQTHDYEVEGGRKWICRVALALKIGYTDEAPPEKLEKARERIVRAMAKTMFVRAVLAGHTYGVDPEVVRQIQEDRDEILRQSEPFVKKEGQDTAEWRDEMERA